MTSPPVWVAMARASEVGDDGLDEGRGQWRVGQHWGRCGEDEDGLDSRGWRAMVNRVEEKGVREDDMWCH